MNKITYLAKKLKTFTYTDILLLAEMEESELKKTLAKLEKEGILKNTKQGYIYAENQLLSQKSKPKKELSNKNIVTVYDLELTGDLKMYEYKAFTPEDAKFLERIPEFNKKMYYKYTKLFLLTNLMTRKEMLEFVIAYNKKYPNDKTSYSSIARAKRNYLRYGARGITSKYHNDQTYVYLKNNQHFFKLFTKLYLSPLKPSCKKCRTEIAKCFNVDIELTPSIRRYRAYLKANFTQDEVKRQRSLICF